MWNSAHFEQEQGTNMLLLPLTAGAEAWLMSRLIETAQAEPYVPFSQ
jgi:hypothetical protein